VALAVITQLLVAIAISIAVHGAERLSKKGLVDAIN
jgi:hypothetical protein